MGPFRIISFKRYMSEKRGEKELKSSKLSILLFVLAFLVLIHQYVTFGIWWEMRQFLHHENIAAILAAVGVGMLIPKLDSRTHR